MTKATRYCQMCGVEIPAERVEALPDTRVCVACSAKIDGEYELTAVHENSYFDDDKPMLAQRIEKLDTGYSWAEDPPSRTRHLVTNVRIRPGGTSSEVTLDCNFVVYRTRLATDEDLWVGCREDTLRKENGEWRIARRKILLDQTVLKSKNLSSFL